LTDFEEVVDLHRRMIERTVATYEANPEVARELVQDIFFAVWRALPTFGGRASLRTYIARIAHNRCVSHVARAAARPQIVTLENELPTAAPGPEARAIASSQRGELLEAIRRLPLGLRAVMTLTLEGFAAPEIAGVLGTTPNAVAIRLTRARAQLRDLLQRNIA
jgi:RNA polymerase sigma factor (sigma-70 family)